MPSTLEQDVEAVAEIIAGANGISWVYQLLREIESRHGLTDAWLVVDPGGVVSHHGEALRATRQLFTLSATAASPDTVRSLLQRPPGVYGRTEKLDAATNVAIGAMCSAAFRASAVSLGSAIDPESGLFSNVVIRDAVARAVACGARYGWSSTLVLLTTGGEAAPEVRWQALASALRQALRSGDEAGVTSPGVAAALLGNAGPEAVRPFIGRVRAALSAGGWQDVDLHAATARTPEETVDPTELTRLAAERLADAGIDTSALPAASSMLELELRLLPGVVWVAMATPIVVCFTSPSASVHDRVLRLVRSRLPRASVRVLTVSDDGSASERSAPGSPAPATGVHVDFGHEHINGNGNGHGNGHESGHESGEGNDPALSDATPHAISATAPGSEHPSALGEGTRVLLLSATFDPARGTSEVSLTLGARRGTGRAPAGPLAGGAQATLNALSALSIDVPFYLVSSERAHGVPGEPVIVVLAPKRGTEASGESVERLGVASGAEDVEAASRATLGALNRHLTRRPVVP